MTLINDILGQIEKNHNVLLYKQEIYEAYQTKTSRDNWAFVTSPKRGKRALEVIVQILETGEVTKNLSAAALLDIIAEETTDERLVIFVNHFEDMNRRTLDYYQDFLAMKNVYLVANICEDKEFIDNSFLENFVIIEDDEYRQNRTHSVNIKYTILLLLSVFIFLLFVRLQLSYIGYLVSALWFTLLMYRSIYYITR